MPFQRFHGQWSGYGSFRNSWFPRGYHYERVEGERVRRMVYGDYRYGAPPTDFPPEEAVLFASYGGRSYEGYAYVLFVRRGELWTNVGSHCSCNGLEEQWEPEQVENFAELERVEERLRSNEHDESAIVAWRTVVQVLRQRLHGGVIT